MEREIEKAGVLPPGTVVIHCPNSEGPRKIAAMLIAMEHGTRAHKLRDIANLHDVFSKHQKAIRALEEMYASMWRLVVAVAPPFRTEHERINKAIARVLYEEITEKVLNSRQNGELPNDPLMCRELEAATAKQKSARGNEVVRIKDNRGSEKAMPAKEFEVCQLALKMLKSNPAVQDYLREQPAVSGDGHEANSSLSIEGLEKAIAAQFSNKLATDEPKPVIIDVPPPEPVKILEFSKWFNSVDKQLPDSKTRRQFRKAKPRLKELCQPLPPELQTRFFGEFGEQLISQSTRTVSNYVNADQLISDATDRVNELLRQNEKIKEPTFEAKQLWDFKDETK